MRLIPNFLCEPHPLQALARLPGRRLRRRGSETGSLETGSSSGESTNFRFPVTSASRLPDAPPGYGVKAVAWLHFHYERTQAVKAIKPMAITATPKAMSRMSSRRISSLPDDLLSPDRPLT